MSRNQARTCAERGALAPRVRRPRHSPLERPLVAAILALSIALAGCLDGAGGEIAEPAAIEQPPHSETEPVEHPQDQASDRAGDAAPSEPVPVEHPVSVDIAVQFHVYYIGDNRCASEFVQVDGPIANVNLTATWEYSIPVVGENLELRVFNGTDGEAGGHAGWPQGEAIAHAEGDSPLTLDVDIAAGNQIRLVVCDWSDVVVREAFDVRIGGSLLYLDPAPEAT